MGTDPAAPAHRPAASIESENDFSMTSVTPEALLVLVACGFLPTACAKKTDATLANFTRAMSEYLERRGDLCLGKNVWPIDVTEAELASGARNAVQMPVLESLGLVTASDAVALVKDEDDAPVRLEVKRYQLTDAGKRHYLTRDQAGSDQQAEGLTKAGKRATESDFCVAKLSLDQIARWQLGGGQHSQAVVTYTYRVDAPDWVKTSEARRVFPAVARVLDGEGTAQLKEGFTLTKGGWVANELTPGPDLMARQSSR
jgi:hypothetical protein